MSRMRPEARDGGTHSQWVALRRGHDRKVVQQQTCAVMLELAALLDGLHRYRLQRQYGKKGLK